MQYRKLGNSGAVVCNLCLGTMTFGWEATEDASSAIMDAYVAAGGNFFDTADVYSTGTSEEIIGRWLKAHPTEAKQIVIATKGRFPMGDGPNDVGLSPPASRRCARCLAEAARRRAHRSLSDARLGRAHPDRGNPAIPR